MDRAKGVKMNQTHVGRLPEYYQQKNKDLLWDEINQISTQRILVIDDEAHIRDAYRRLFWHYGFEVLTASNATQANELLVQSKFDIVLLDIKMAEVDGSVLYGLIRTFHKNVKVVVSSVYSVDEQKERIEGADAYFDKSDGKNVLLGIIASLSGGPAIV
jgi:DNA-binding NtrC family response regulator